VPSALGYLPWWMAAGWQSVPWNKLDRLVLFDAPIQNDGSLLERDWLSRASALSAHAAGLGIPVDLALTLFQQSQFDQVFADQAARKRLLTNAFRWLDQPFVAGLHLDVEGYSTADPKAIAGFRGWLTALDEKRREAGKGLSAFFPASDSFAVYDAASARRIDYWVAQLYDAHWVESKVTGPLITRDEGNAVAVPRALARLHSLGVARRSVLLSLPLYGWQWPSETDRPGAAARGRARLLTFAPTPESLMPNDRLAASELALVHGLRRDREHTPYYAYRDGEHWVQGWFEDVASLTRKLAPERSQGYAGLAFFALGYDKGEIVEAMLRWWRTPG
jgi:glycosyl hydrolase family 18 (putative chitinase)